MHTPDILSRSISDRTGNLQAMLQDCRKLGWAETWHVIYIFILITGVMANAALLWLLFRDGRTLSASQVLGVNLAVMDLLSLSTMPFSLYFEKSLSEMVIVVSNHSVNSSTSSGMNEAKDIFSMFSLIGCPLLLTCMCIERYLAVMKPVLYLRVRRWEYRMAVSAMVWGITLSFCLAMGLKNDIIIMMVPVSIIISFLFLLMLACLGGVVWSLCQQSPALTAIGNQAHCMTPLKRRAVGNVLAVVVPAVMSYLPVLVMFPLVLYKFYVNRAVDSVMCTVFELSRLFPKFGLLIGPLFYFSKTRQMCCPTRGKK